tara:strand:- start:2535 stop:3599 length:1065 start_codon:yes stop_codon:yes gene_type:complete
MKKNFLISTGGSGGHVVPATILHEHLSKNANITISTDKRGLKYLDKEFYRIEIIDTPKLNNIFLLPSNFFVILFLTFKSFYLLKKYKIDDLISTGGYMSLPLIWAARLLNLNIYLVEPNLVLGRANKFFLKNCKNIFCYSEELKNFPDIYKDKIIVIKPLVKKYLYNLDKFTTNKNKFTLLIVGGSQGANFFDKNLKNIILNISKNNWIKVIHQTNESNISNLKDFYIKNKIENDIFSFQKDLAYTINQTDLCITRAGASTLAELSILNVPFIAVPLPTAKDNHQYENSKFYEIKDCCWIIEQNHFDEKSEDLLIDILANRTVYLKKKENLKRLNYQNTWINVNQKILKVIYEN